MSRSATSSMRALIAWAALLLPAPSAAQEDPVDPAAFSAMSWRSIGPFRGGRSNSSVGVPSQPRTFYMGTVGGGVWKTTDAGITWTNVSDGQLATSSVGALAVAESDPNVVYVGMGEHAIRGVMTSHGDGVYRSTDAGRTWSHLGLDRTRAISRIRVHPNDPDLVYVAAQGAPYGANEERGIYRSKDGGATWELVLSVDENTGASDLSMDMTNPRILYAAFWEHRRLPWQVQSGGEGSGFFKSTDGGDTWNRIENGLPDNMGKTSIDVSRANPQRVFAIVEADPGGGIFRSDNGGESWELMSENWTARARAWYYIEIFADPTDQETVYVLNAPMLKSIDGGRNFTNVRVPHGDTHDLWINPNDNEIMINSNDGGANVSFNAGASWSTQTNQATAQFYRVNVDNRFQQDNSSVAIASMGQGGISWKDWYDVGGCESAYTAFDPDAPRLVYAGCYMGIISEYDHQTSASRDVGVYPVLPAALQGREMKYRYNWNAPIVASPQDYSTIYHASNHLVRTQDRGMTWEEISPDLTRDNDAQQGYGGGPITNEGAGGEIYGTIYYVAPSEHERGTIWTGSDDGLIYLTRDEGATWTNVTPDDLEEGQINAIEVSPHDPATAYVVYTRYKFNDFTPHVLVTTDYGRSWDDRTAGIAEEAFARVVREDPVRPGLLYLGTETGLYISWNQGEQWQQAQLNLPNTPINDLIIQRRENDLVAATAGRSFWILDDLTPLQNAPDALASETYLHAPRHAYRLAGGGGFGGFGNNSVGQNPPSGAVLHYYMAEAPEEGDTVRVAILSPAGDLIRTYSTHPDEELSPGAQPIKVTEGDNRVVWDLRHEQIPNIPGAYVFGSLAGRRVVPGDYQVRLSVGNFTMTQPLEVRMDPRVDANMAEYIEQDAFVASVAAELTDIHRSTIDVKDVKGQIETLVGRIEGRDGADVVGEVADALAGDLETVADSLYQARVVDGQTVINFPSRLKFQYVWLHGNAEGAETGVTRGSEDVLGDLRVRWTTHRTTVTELLGPRLDALNELLQQYGFGAIIAPPVRRRPIS
ncbi:MAG: glycosyl hydrolase [Gemmatimonadetes bacterium]|nr:glycosyl hydrolase [Gemmatimonadota bacterium]